MAMKAVLPSAAGNLDPTEFDQGFGVGHIRLP